MHYSLLTISMVNALFLQGLVIFERFGENDERNVVVALIRMRYIMALDEQRTLPKMRLYN